MLLSILATSEHSLQFSIEIRSNELTVSLPNKPLVPNGYVSANEIPGRFVQAPSTSLYSIDMNEGANKDSDPRDMGPALLRSLPRDSSPPEQPDVVVQERDNLAADLKRIVAEILNEEVVNQPTAADLTVRRNELSRERALYLGHHVRNYKNRTCRKCPNDERRYHHLIVQRLLRCRSGGREFPPPVERIRMRDKNECLGKIKGSISEQGRISQR